MEFKNILYSVQEGVVLIQINRPKAYNALNTATNEELEKALDLIGKDESARVLIITGNEKVFVAGADVSELMDADPEGAFCNCSLAHRVFKRIENLSIPTIAAVNGMALGGGLELALSCDFRIAGEKAVFGLPEITLGIIPGAGGTQRLARLVGSSYAKEMIFLGKKVPADRALAIGLVNETVADDQVLEAAKKMASKLCKMPAVALALAKESINYGVGHFLKEGLEYEQEKFSSAFDTDDQKEGMKAFFERRPPVFSHK